MGLAGIQELFILVPGFRREDDCVKGSWFPAFAGKTTFPLNVLILKIPLNLPLKKGEDSGCKPEPAKKLLL